MTTATTNGHALPPPGSQESPKRSWADILLGPDQPRDLHYQKQILNTLEAMVVNVATSRSHIADMLSGPSDNLNLECHYPQSPDCFFYRALYDREPIAKRACCVMAHEAWSTVPTIYEDEKRKTVTPFEKAWDSLGKSLNQGGGRSWLGGDQTSPIWTELRQLDVLSGIGQFGAMLMGMDDGRNLQDAADGVEVFVGNSSAPHLPPVRMRESPMSDFERELRERDHEKAVATYNARSASQDGKRRQENGKLPGGGGRGERGDGQVHNAPRGKGRGGKRSAAAGGGGVQPAGASGGPGGVPAPPMHTEGGKQLQAGAGGQGGSTGGSINPYSGQGGGRSISPGGADTYGPAWRDGEGGRGNFSVPSVSWTEGGRQGIANDPDAMSRSGFFHPGYAAHPDNPLTQYGPQEGGAAGSDARRAQVKEQFRGGIGPQMGAQGDGVHGLGGPGSLEGPGAYDAQQTPASSAGFPWPWSGSSPGDGPFVHGTDGNQGDAWHPGLGMRPPYQGPTMSGTDQQYFGVQMGPSQVFSDTPAGGVPPSHPGAGGGRGGGNGQGPGSPPQRKLGPNGKNGNGDGWQAHRRLTFLQSFDESLVQVVRYEWNINNPRFGMPVMYRIMLNDPRQPHSGVGLPLATVYVHWSRVLHAFAERHSSRVFGIPVMQAILNCLMDIRKVRGAGAEGYWKSCFPILSLESNPQLGADVIFDQAKMQQMVQDIYAGLTRSMSLMGWTAKTLPPNVLDPSPHIDKAVEAICIEKSIPKRIFMGSEIGVLASQQDADNWKTRVNAHHDMHTTPMLVSPLVNRFIQLGILPEPEEFFARWPSMDALSASDKAGIAGQLTTAITTYVAQNGAGLVPERDFITRVLDWDDEVADEVLANLKAAKDAAAKAAPPGGAPAVGPDGKPLPPGAPGAPPPAGGAPPGPDGGGGGSPGAPGTLPVKPTVLNPGQSLHDSTTGKQLGMSPHPPGAGKMPFGGIPGKGVPPQPPSGGGGAAGGKPPAPGGGGAPGKPGGPPRPSPVMKGGQPSNPPVPSTDDELDQLTGNSNPDGCNQVTGPGCSKEAHEMTRAEYQVSGAPDYGDMVHAGGQVGFLRGASLGRVKVVDKDGKTLALANPEEVKLIRRMKDVALGRGYGTADAQPARIDPEFMARQKKDLEDVEALHGEALFSKKYVDGLKKRLARGDRGMTQEVLDRETAKHAGKLAEAEEAEGKMREIKGREIKMDFASAGRHHQMVSDALAMGKHVPDRVLADYPDLAARAKGVVNSLPGDLAGVWNRLASGRSTHDDLWVITDNCQEGPNKGKSGPCPTGATKPGAGDDDNVPTSDAPGDQPAASPPPKGGLMRALRAVAHAPRAMRELALHAKVAVEGAIQRAVDAVAPGHGARVKSMLVNLVMIEGQKALFGKALGGTMGIVGPSYAHVAAWALSRAVVGIKNKLKSLAGAYAPSHPGAGAPTRNSFVDESGDEWLILNVPAAPEGFDAQPQGDMSPQALARIAAQCLQEIGGHLGVDFRPDPRKLAATFKKGLAELVKTPEQPTPDGQAAGQPVVMDPASSQDGTDRGAGASSLQDEAGDDVTSQPLSTSKEHQRKVFNKHGKGRKPVFGQDPRTAQLGKAMAASSEARQATSETGEDPALDDAQATVGQHHGQMAMSHSVLADQARERGDDAQAALHDQASQAHLQAFDQHTKLARVMALKHPGREPKPPHGQGPQAAPPSPQPPSQHGQSPQTSMPPTEQPVTLPGGQGSAEEVPPAPTQPSPQTPAQPAQRPEAPLANQAELDADLAAVNWRPDPVAAVLWVLGKMVASVENAEAHNPEGHNQYAQGPKVLTTKASRAAELTGPARARADKLLKLQEAAHAASGEAEQATLEAGGNADVIPQPTPAMHHRAMANHHNKVLSMIGMGHETDLDGEPYGDGDAHVRAAGLHQEAANLHGELEDALQREEERPTTRAKPGSSAVPTTHSRVCNSDDEARDEHGRWTSTEHEYPQPIDSLKKFPMAHKIDEANLDDEGDARDEFVKALKKSYPKGVPVFQEAPLKALQGILDKGLDSNDSAENTNFFTIGKPPGFVPGKDKLLIRCTIRPKDARSLYADMRYEGGSHAELLKEHGEVYGADVAREGVIKPADIDEVHVIRGGKIVKTLRPEK